MILNILDIMHWIVFGIGCFAIIMGGIAFAVKGMANRVRKDLGGNDHD